MGVAARGVLLLVVGCSLASCFFGYDSRWGAAERSQRAVAREATPGELQPSHDAPQGAPNGVRVLRIRAYATPRFTAEVVDQRTYLRSLIDGANRVVEPTLNVQLKLVEVRTWKPSSRGNDMAAMLDELVAADAADDVDRVVGMVGSLPHLGETYDNIGFGAMLGKHIVVRALTSASEFDAIESLDELDVKERQRLYRARSRHKAITVFLHELGHTLGIPHTRARHTIMFSQYDLKTTGFGTASTRLMRTTCAQRRGEGSEADLAVALIKDLRDTRASWVAEDYAELRAQLKQTARTEPVAPTSPPPLIPGLERADGAHFLRSLELEREHRFEQAREIAAPLFTKYPRSHEVQDLRCRLALAEGGSADDILKHECAALMRIVEERSAADKDSSDNP
jgi:hypothetical protein